MNEEKKLMNNRSDHDLFLQLLSDEPIDNLNEDGLSLEHWAKVIAGVALKTKGPFTIGIFGSWGTGKTSILQLAKNIIDENIDEVRQQEGVEVATVSFNAWQYEQEEKPLIPLIASIVQELDKFQKLSGRFKENTKKLQDAMRSIIYSFSAQVKGKIPFMSEVSLGLDSAKAIERYEKLRADWIDKQIDQSLYYNAFETLKDAQSKGSVHRVIVFIDDLDRCFPNKAIQLLESIKLVLSQPGFIFVLAVDRRVLENYLEKIYRDDFGIREYNQGQSYLDKIIQLPLWIPPHEKRFETLVQKLLKHPALSTHKDIFEPLINVICLACDHNPRQLKRFFNDLLVDQQVYTYLNSGEIFPLEGFVIARGFRHQSENIYHWLRRDNDLCNKLNCEYEEMKEKLKNMINTNKAEDAGQKRLKELLERDSLLQLLSTDAGHKWLGDRNLRDNIENFLSQERQLDSQERQLDQWIQEQMGRAWLQLSSDIEGDIRAACHTLTALPLPPSMHSTICQRLEELTKHPNPNISHDANYTYEAICAHRGD